MAAPELSRNELKFLAGLTRRNVRFLLVGLSAAALQGAPVVTQDVDLWFENLNDPGIADVLKELGAAYVAPVELNPPMFVGGGLELFDIVSYMHGLVPLRRRVQRPHRTADRWRTRSCLASAPNHRKQTSDKPP